MAAHRVRTTSRARARRGVRLAAVLCLLPGSLWLVPSAAASGGSGERAAQSEDVEAAALGYRLLGRLGSGRLVPNERVLDAKAEKQLLASGASTGACPSKGLVGRASAPAGTGAELAFWLSLADLYRQKEPGAPEQAKGPGRGTLLHVQRTGGKRMERSGGEHANASASRDVVAFVPVTGVSCRGQIKVYQRVADEWVSPAETAVERLGTPRAREAGRASSSGMSPRQAAARGQLLWEMGPKSAAGGVPRERVEGQTAEVGDAGAAQALPEPGYVLRIHLANDADDRSGRGEVRDYTLICESKEPLWARSLGGFERSIGADKDGGWTACVWQSGRKVSEPTR